MPKYKCTLTVLIDQLRLDVSDSTDLDLWAILGADSAEVIIVPGDTHVVFRMNHDLNNPYTVHVNVVMIHPIAQNKYQLFFGPFHSGRIYSIPVDVALFPRVGHCAHRTARDVDLEFAELTGRVIE